MKYGISPHLTTAGAQKILYFTVAFLYNITLSGGWRNGRRARLRTVWTKVLKGSTPFPPISFEGVLR